MNFEHRNVLLKHVMNQLYSATRYMHSFGIIHRDLDHVNVNVIYPSMTLKIMDFAKSFIPDIQGYDRTEDPVNILRTAEEEKSKVMSEITELRKLANTHTKLTPDESKQLEMKLAQKDMWGTCVDTYRSPVQPTSMLIPHYYNVRIEKPDEIQLKDILYSVIEKHLQEFEWSKGTPDEITVHQENTLLSEFIAHCMQLSLDEVIILTNVNKSQVDESLPQHGPVGQYGQIADIDEINMQKTRHIINSNAWKKLNEARGFPIHI